jgi:DnaJ-class molecular chaperone
MRRILNYRKVLGVGETTELKELKTVYRNLMKDWHPDKFQDSSRKGKCGREKQEDHRSLSFPGKYCSRNT